MADLRIEDPNTTETFVQALSALNVKLPLSLSDEDVGVVLDADKHDVFTVDVNGERDNDEAAEIALWIVMAVNTCGGFKAVRQ